jgi:hypothetical protein
MKHLKENSVKIILLLSILGFYMFVCRYPNDDINLNDLSYFKTDCSKNCEISNDVLKCLDLCSGTNIQGSNRVLYLILLSLISFLVYITYKNELDSLFEHIKDRLGYKSKYNRLKIDEETQEDEMYHYYKISDI